MAFKNGTSLRGLREARGLTALEMAALAECPVEVVLKGEFGVAVPMGDGLRARLAAAYGLEIQDYVRLALDEAERYADRFF